MQTIFALINYPFRANEKTASFFTTYQNLCSRYSTHHWKQAQTWPQGLKPPEHGLGINKGIFLYYP